MSIEGIQSTQQVSYQAPVSNTVVKENSEAASSTPEVSTPKEAPERGANYSIASPEKSNGVAEEEPSQVSLDAIKKTVNELNKANHNNTVQFGVHEETNRMTIKILDKDTRKVVKEFPAEKSLDLIAKALEMAGMLVDEKR
ncbi:MAG: flagellar protein FlaG [Lachnospiraceae bacterium]